MGMDIQVNFWGRTAKMGEATQKTDSGSQNHYQGEKLKVETYKWDFKEVRYIGKERTRTAGEWTYINCWDHLGKKRWYSEKSNGPKVWRGKELREVGGEDNKREGDNID